MKKIRIAAFVLMVIWMGYIFAMSQRTADESTKDSEKVGALIGKMVVPDFEMPQIPWEEAEPAVDAAVAKYGKYVYPVIGISAAALVALIAGINLQRRKKRLSGKRQPLRQILRKLLQRRLRRRQLLRRLKPLQQRRSWQQ